MDRATELQAIEASLGDAVVASDDRLVIVHGDSLAALRRLPDASISLILTDPPYHSTKKSNIRGDTAFEEDEHFLDWMEEYAAEWKRVLKLSGTAYVFCASQMAARLEVTIAKHIRPIGQITWTKPNEPGFDGWKGKTRKRSLRTWYPHSERVLMFEQGSYGSREAYRRSPVGEYLLECRLATDLSMIELTERIGAYGKINRGGAVANWEAGRNAPSRAQYEMVRATLEATGRIREMLPYEDLVRPFGVSEDIAYTDVWDFPSVRPFPGKHPAEKPVEMLAHIITASSYPGDIVLDCFAGSHSTVLAAIAGGRRAVGIEIDDTWTSRASQALTQLPETRSSHDLPLRQPLRPEQLAVDCVFD